MSVSGRVCRPRGRWPARRARLSPCPAGRGRVPIGPFPSDEPPPRPGGFAKEPVMRQRAVWLAAALVLAGAPAAPAQVVVYDNTTNFTPPIPILLNGGATLQGGNTITTLVADDITPAAGSAGQSVSSFGFIVVNNNSTAVTVRPLARFYD